MLDRNRSSYHPRRFQRVTYSEPTCSAKVTKALFNEARRQGLTIADLADRTGILAACLHRHKSGQNEMKVFDAECLAEVLGGEIRFVSTVKQDNRVRLHIVD